MKLSEFIKQEAIENKNLWNKLYTFCYNDKYQFYHLFKY